jgi:hypothetical protein
VKSVTNNVLVRAGLGIMIMVAGFLALLNGLRVSVVDWHVATPLLIIGLGVWIMLCAAECHQIKAA